MPAGRPRGSGRPSALKLLQGVPTSQLNHDEPNPEPGIPSCPSTDPDVINVWDYTIKQLKVMRTITMADRDALLTYCEAVVLQNRANAVLRKEGIMAWTASGSPCKHPAAGLVAQAAQVIKTFGREFGLTPASRTTIRVGDQTPKTTEKTAARLLSG